MKRKIYTTKNKSKKNSKQLRAYTKKKRKEAGIGTHSRNFVKMICIKCKREYKIDVNKEHLKFFTEEVIKNYICILCRPIRRRVI